MQLRLVGGGFRSTDTEKLGIDLPASVLRSRQRQDQPLTARKRFKRSAATTLRHALLMFVVGVAGLSALQLIVRSLL